MRFEDYINRPNSDTLNRLGQLARDNGMLSGAMLITIDTIRQWERKYHDPQMRDLLKSLRNTASQIEDIRNNAMFRDILGPEAPEG